MSKSTMFMLSLQPFMNVMCLILQLSVFLSVPCDQLPPDSCAKVLTMVSM